MKAMKGRSLQSSLEDLSESSFITGLLLLSDLKKLHLFSLFVLLSLFFLLFGLFLRTPRLCLLSEETCGFIFTPAGQFYTS
ncbi:hypothetical protein SRHO_G00076330 [Serrasalmus rhombeus]